MQKTAEILCIGTEILLGNIVDTNSQVISRGLAELGISVFRHTAVGDNPERLREALSLALSRSDIVITTGGLGPTYDDLSKETVAAWFGLPLEPHAPSIERLHLFFQRYNCQMTENNLKQAMLPRGCIVLENQNGTAPGAIIEQDGKVAVLMPGPPREMLPMFQKQVMPFLMKFSEGVLHSHCIYFFGIGESSLEDALREQMMQMTNPTLAPYAKDGEVMLRLTAAAKTEEQAEALMAPVLTQLLEQFPQLIYGIDIDNLQTALVQQLTENRLKIAVAESCTGGLIAKRITEVAGSSAVFDCGVVSYANPIKEQLLGVRHETLAQFGAVSPETAREMADGIRRISGADIGISSTGIAGPAGGTLEKPVGLVYIGVSSKQHNEVITLHLARGYDNERDSIRYLASSHALALALRVARKMRGSEKNK